MHLQPGSSHHRSQPDLWSLERAPCSLANTAKLLMELQKVLSNSLEAFLTSFLYLRWACITFPALRFSFVQLLLQGHLPLFLRDYKADVHFRVCLFALTNLRGQLSLLDEIRAFWTKPIVSPNPAFSFYVHWWALLQSTLQIHLKGVPHGTPRVADQAFQHWALQLEQNLSVVWQSGFRRDTL